MMRQKNALLFILTLFSFILCDAQTVSYTYDSTGNRSKREIVYSLSNARGEETNTANYMDRLLDHAITVSPNPIRGQMKVRVDGLDDSDNCQMRIYNLSGTPVLSSLIGEVTTIVDMSGVPKGNYILQVTLNGKQSTWKLLVE
ncbi:MAG: T9SS type A sorting domain-containing protein [Bacteroidaceae bacterium]|nr:T9SS type A sorting domain-containing protein [Bacteroidaceae bacterium]